MLTRRERTALGGGAALIAAILVVGRGVPHASRWNERTVLEASYDLRRLRLMETVDRDRATLRDSLEFYRVQLDSLDARTFAAPSPAMAGVSLAGLLEHLASQHGVAVSSSVVIADSTFALSRVRIAVRLFAVADSPGIFGLLRAIESTALGLEVTELVVSQPEPAASESQPESLRIEVLVSARARASRSGNAS